MIRRRDLLAMLGGAAVAWPRAAKPQGPARRPVVGVLFPVPEEIARPSLAAIRSKLAELGLVEGRDVDLAVRYAAIPDRETASRLGEELLALSPAVIVMLRPVTSASTPTPLSFSVSTIAAGELSVTSPEVDMMRPTRMSSVFSANVMKPLVRTSRWCWSARPGTNPVPRLSEMPSTLMIGSAGSGCAAVMMMFLPAVMPGDAVAVSVLSRNRKS